MVEVVNGMRLKVLASLFALLAFAVPAEAQILYGGMVGTVLDLSLIHI